MAMHIPSGPPATPPPPAKTEGQSQNPPVKTNPEAPEYDAKGQPSLDALKKAGLAVTDTDKSGDLSSGDVVSVAFQDGTQLQLDLKDVPKFYANYKQVIGIEQQQQGGNAFKGPTAPELVSSLKGYGQDPAKVIAAMRTYIGEPNKVDQFIYQVTAQDGQMQYVWPGKHTELDKDGHLIVKKFLNQYDTSREVDIDLTALFVKEDGTLNKTATQGGFTITRCNVNPDTYWYTRSQDQIAALFKEPREDAHRGFLQIVYNNLTERCRLHGG